MLENALLYKKAKESEERYEGLFHAVDVGIVSFGSQGNVVQCNRQAEKLLCIPVGESGYSACRGLLFDKHPQLIEDLVRSYALSSNPALLSQRVIAYGREENGNEQPLEVSFSVWGAKRTPTITATIMKMR